jgi:hypothetical protein
MARLRRLACAVKQIVFQKAFCKLQKAFLLLNREFRIKRKRFGVW